MFKLNDKLNKVNILITALLLLSLIVIGQSIYIAKIYGTDLTTKTRNSLEIANKNTKVKQPKIIFDDFDNEFMTNHFKEFRKIKEHMNKVFDDAFSKFDIDNNLNDDFTDIFGNTKLGNNINLSLKDEDNKFIITIKLPNSHKNNVDVKLDGQQLTVSGNIQDKIEESNEGVKQVRQYSSNFTRSLFLPAKINKNSLSTKFEGSNLIITVIKDDIT